MKSRALTISVSTNAKASPSGSVFVTAAFLLLSPAMIGFCVERPNVIVILTDDQGWADLSCQGEVPDVRTPHIDALADRGVRCLAGYITAPQCSPSRAGLITGRYQQRYGIDTIPDVPLPLEAVTLAERVAPLGYRTGFVGKWHLEPNVTCQKWFARELPEMVGKPRNQVRIPLPKILRFSPTRRGLTNTIGARCVTTVSITISAPASCCPK